MVDAMSDSIIKDPSAVISKLFGMVVPDVVGFVDSGVDGRDPDTSSDFDVTKTFKDAFASAQQHEKVYHPKL